MGVLSAVEHFFNETAMQARTPASNRLAKANRASHDPRGKLKGKSKENKGKSKRIVQRIQKTHAGVKRRQLVSPFLKTSNQRQARIFGNQSIWDMFVPLTRHGFSMNGVLTNGATAGVRRSGMTTGVLLDGMRVENKRMTHLQAHFHLEVWISVPRVVRRDLKG